MATMKHLPRRDEVPAERTWNKADVYASDEAWEEVFAAASTGVQSK